MLVTLLLAAILPFACQAGLVGGKTKIELPEDDPTVLFAVNKVNAFYAQAGDNDERTLVKVVKAESQIIAGVLYTLLLEVKANGVDELCEVKLWSQPWALKEQQLRLTDEPSCKEKVKAPIHGGLKPVDPKTKEVQAALAFAVARMNSMENFLYLRKASNIGSVTSQVVAGMAYHFRQVELAATECSKLLSRNPQNADCPISNAMANVRVCDFDVYDKAWMTTRYTLANMVCKAKPLIGGDDHDVQPHGDQMLGGDDHDLVPHGDQVLGGDDHDKVPHVTITGGLKPVDTKTKEVQAALAFAVARMNSMENFLYLRKASNIGSVTSQVVAGMAYHFRQVELAATECSKLLSRKPQNADCPISNSMANVRVCDFDVYDKAWMTTRYTLANMVCKAKPLIGGDDHDVQPHGDQVLGGDDHDLIPHGDQVLGGDDLDPYPSWRPSAWRR